MQVSWDFLNKSWDTLTNVKAPSISGSLACLEQPEQLIVIVILQWTVVGNKSLFVTIEAFTLKANPDDIKSKYLMKKCFFSQTSILSHNMTHILRTWYIKWRPLKSSRKVSGWDMGWNRFRRISLIIMHFLFS